MNENPSLENRVARLERQVATWRFASLVMVALVVASVGTGAALAAERYLTLDSLDTRRATIDTLKVTNTIEAPAIMIRDRNGQIRGVFGMGVTGPAEPRLDLRDNNGKTRAALSAEDDVSSLFLGGEGGNPSISLRASMHDSLPTGLNIHDQNGKTRVELEVDTDGNADSAHFQLKNKNEKTAFYASSQSWGGGLTVQNKFGRIGLESSVRSLDVSEPVLEVWSFNPSSRRLQLGLEKSEPFIRILGPDGAIAWEPKQAATTAPTKDRKAPVRPEDKL